METPPRRDCPVKQYRYAPSELAQTTLRCVLGMPPEMKNAMARQAEVQREKRAKNFLRAGRQPWWCALARVGGGGARC